MQNRFSVYDLAVSGAIALAAIVAMVLDAQADNGGTAMMVFGAGLGLVLFAWAWRAEG